MTKYEKINLTAFHDTVLKTHPINASELAAGAIYPVKKNTELTAVRIGHEKHHYQLEFDQPLKASRHWWAFIGHWKVELANPEGDPVVSFTSKPTNKGRAIKLPNISGEVYLGDAICSASPNFFWYEATHDGSRIPINTNHVSNIIKIASAAQSARDRIDKPFKITSWYRPEPFNRNAGGARNSTHLSGMALDFLVSGMTGRHLARVLSDWPGGMGIYPHFPNLLHIDVRGYRARWGGA